MMSKFINILLLFFPIVLFGQSAFIDSLKERSEATFKLHLQKLNKNCIVDTVLGIADDKGNNFLIWKYNDNIFYSNYNSNSFVKRNVCKNRFKKYFDESKKDIMKGKSENLNYNCSENIRTCRYIIVKCFNYGNNIKEVGFFLPENWNNFSEISNFILLYDNILYLK